MCVACAMKKPTLKPRAHMRYVIVVGLKFLIKMKMSVRVLCVVKTYIIFKPTESVS